MLLFFVIGDIIGAGIYALVGAVGGEVGGAIWTAFTVALVLALCTAFAYAELVTKYPHAGGAALFVHRAYGIPFVTFMVAFAVMASGITSASTLSRSFGGDYLQEFIDIPTTIAALVFIVLVGLINFRGISESVKTNVALTFVELTGLLIVVLVGLWVLGSGDGDAGRNFEFKPRLFSFIALLAVANGALINMIMASRLLYGMANERVLPDPFARVHRERRTPWVAIIVTTALAMILISIGRLDDLAFTTVMLLLAVFAMVNVAVLVLRREPVDRPYFVAPVLFPVLGS
jgi:amino acid transporter